MQNNQFKIKNYDISDFDEQMKLKFGANNLLFVAGLLSPIVLALMASIIAKKGASNYLSLFFGDISLMLICIASTLPCVLFLASSVMQNEEKKSIFSRLYSNGHNVLKISAGLNVIAWIAVVAVNSNASSVFQVGFLTLSILLTYYAFTSKRLYDFFLSHCIN